MPTRGDARPTARSIAGYRRLASIEPGVLARDFALCICNA
jgi:hypothetical protein